MLIFIGGLIILIALVTPPQLFSYPGLDSALSAQRNRLPADSDLFHPLDQPDNAGLSGIQLEDYRFLLAYLPLADIAVMKARDLMFNIKLARAAIDGLPWGDSIPTDIYRHFVLPHRVAQEPFVDWRAVFYNELTPRVMNLDMEQAALEVNHWCFEKATFRQTDARDQDPLTTIRSGFGRCEEEMILAICALRSVGIPARACHTPYWAHIDNNHAWVEVWVDGRWHYFGACEPEPVLNQAWFTGAASRAMLVVSTAFGDYYGDEPVLRRYGRSTLINSTAVYGDTKRLKVNLVNAQRAPVPNHRVIFNLWNYGAIMPAIAIKTDGEGELILECGRGDWFITSGRDDVMALAHTPADCTHITVQLGPAPIGEATMEFNYSPPPELKEGELDVASAETQARALTPQRTQRTIVPKDSLFKLRLAKADSLREVQLGGRWFEVGGKYFPHDRQPATRPDEIWAGLIAVNSDWDTSKVLEYLNRAKGNWGNCYAYLTHSFPLLTDGLHTPVPFQPELIKGLDCRLKLTECISEKDLRDSDALIALGNHIEMTTLQYNLTDDNTLDSLQMLADGEFERVWDYVVNPRIDHEPLTPWRKDLIEFFLANPNYISDAQDDALMGFIRDSLTVEPVPDRLGPPLAPDQCLRMRRGTRSDIERLYIAMCRVRVIPARRNPAGGEAEVWHINDWQAVNLFDSAAQPMLDKGKCRIFFDIPDANKIDFSAEYMKDWAIQSWEGDHFSLMDYGYHIEFKMIDQPLLLSPGRYIVSYGRRESDGTVTGIIKFFEAVPQGEKRLVLKL